MKTLQPVKAAHATPATIEFLMREHGFTRRQAIAHAQSDRAKAELYANDVYHVQVFRDGLFIRLSICRRDGAVILRDWREFQEIKNQILGPEIEAAELYPAESRKMDEANIYHLWCLSKGEKFRFGFSARNTPVFDRDQPPTPYDWPT